MVRLTALVPSVGTGAPHPASVVDSPTCDYCGEAIGQRPGVVVPPTPCCALCGLALDLGRPRIDEEARLIWLPELSQPALNAVTRHLHIALRRYSETLEPGLPLSSAAGDRPLLYHAGKALLARKQEAEARLGTTDPSALADALRQMAPAAFARRDVLLGGLRMLPMGRLFDAETDIYPQIVDSWLNAGDDAAPPQAGDTH